MAIITINSKAIFVNGDVSIDKGLLFVNEELFLSLRKFPEDSINIAIDGDLKSLTIDSCNSLQVNGKVKNLRIANNNHPKNPNSQRMSFGDERPFLSNKFTEKSIDIIVNGKLKILTVETCQSLQINGESVSL